MLINIYHVHVKTFIPQNLVTSIVLFIRYRAPELLFGARIYGTGVDVWAVGCVLAEILQRLPFLAGETGEQSFAFLLGRFKNIDQCYISVKTAASLNCDANNTSTTKTFAPYKSEPFAQLYICANSDYANLLHLSYFLVLLLCNLHYYLCTFFIVQA